MARAGRTFRIFVSSTFSDLKEERNALQERVFPRLRRLCMQHGARFQAIDLRWGVSEEAALDQQTMNICLGEIERCRWVTPRPNFIVLLGDRYGWRPLPPQIVADEFEEISQRISPEEQQRLKEWYLKDDNAVPPEYCLRPREGEYEDFDRWEAVERDLRAILLKAVEEMPLEAYDRMKYEASATEQEIAQGALRVADAAEHVFCFFRTIKDLPQDESAKDFVDLDANEDPDTEAGARRDELKNRLSALLPGNIHEYEAGWTGSGVTTDHLDKLCDDVFKALSGIIEEEMARLEEVDPLDKEIVDHDAFGEDRARFFTGRAGILKTIGEYVRGSDRHPLAVWGESGSGKSALMACAVQQARVDHPNAETVVRFIGASPGSSDIRSLLESVCRQISRRYGADESTVPAGYRELVEEFPKRLALATAQQPLALFLDALDQLSDVEQGRSLIWLPTELPEHVRLIVSALPGECLSALENKLPATSIVELDPMPPAEGRQLLDIWLADAGRALQDHQHEEVLGKFSRNGLPLYLKLAFEESRRWKSYSTDRALSPDIPGVIRDLFGRLSLEANHGEMLVSRSLGYLVAAKNGLSEDEVIDVLSRDQGVFEDFLERARQELPEMEAEERRLPVVIWSRLYFDLEPYLTERSADGASLMAFYHRQLGEVVAEDYLAGEEKQARHRALADYFGGQDLEIREAPNLRKMSELPYQQTLGEMWDELYATLTDFRFLERKSADIGVLESTDAQGNVTRTYAGVFFLQDDFRLALEKMPGNGVGRSGTGGRRPIIVTAVDFGRGPFVRCPGCLQELPLKKGWLGQEIACPQKGCGGPLRVNPFVVGGFLAKTRRERSMTTAIPEPLTPAGRRATLEAFERAIDREAHNLSQRPDILWQQIYNRLQWEDEPVPKVLAPELERRSRPGSAPWFLLLNPLPESEALVRTLGGHTSWIRACAISPDGSFIVSASRDRTLKIWDAGTGQERATLTGHTRGLQGGVQACAISPDSAFIVSASEDGTLKIWDAGTGQERATLGGHTNWVYGCAFSADGELIVSAGADKTLRLWEVATGKERATLRGHANPVRSCAFSPDGGLVVSASEDCTLRLWGVATGKERATLRGHADPVRSCAFSPDGELIVSASEDGTLKLWEVATGKQRATLKGHTDWVCDCAFSPDGELVVSAGWDKTVRLWEVATGKERATLRGHSDPVHSCAFSPDGELVVSASMDCTLRLWEAATGKERATPEGHTRAVHSCAFSPDGELIVSASDDKTLKLWEEATGKERATLKGHTGDVESCAFSPDGELIVSASDDKTLKLWEVATGKERATLRGHSDPVHSCAFSPDGELVVSASMDYELRLWEVPTGKTRAFLVRFTRAVYSCAFSPDGELVVSAGWDKTLRLWEVATGREKATLKGHTSWVYGCAFSPDGELIVSASDDKTLKLWEVATGKERATLRGHADAVHSCAFSPDGELIVSASDDRTLKLWEVATGEEAAVFPVLGASTCVAFSSTQFKACCGDSAGNLYILGVVGFELTQPIKPPPRGSDLVSVGSPDTLSQDTESSQDATRASHLVTKPYVWRGWDLLIPLGAMLVLFLVGYGLTRLSPWFWTVAAPLFMIGVYIIWWVVVIYATSGRWAWGLFNLACTGLVLWCFWTGYYLARLSPWFWIVAVPLFMIGRLWLGQILLGKLCSCPYCRSAKIVSGYQNEARCSKCKEKFFVA